MLTYKELKWYHDRYGVVDFVETGLDQGKTLKEAVKIQEFRDIYSIEIEPHLIVPVSAEINDARVSILCGNSPEVLRRILPYIEGPTLFFLDAYNDSAKPEENPLRAEIEVLFSMVNRRNRRRDVIIIGNLSRGVSSDLVGFGKHLSDQDTNVFVSLIGPTHNMMLIPGKYGQGVLIATPKEAIIT